MIESLQDLINALREELQQYGEMLALLDRQQQNVMERHAGEVFESIAPIQAQGAAIQSARSHREKCGRCTAEAFGVAFSGGFAALVPRLPDAYRPLVRALVDENNELLVRVQQRARQNHLLMSRSLELMQGLLNSLFPSRETRVYNDHGSVQTRTIATRTLYEAVG